MEDNKTRIEMDFVDEEQDKDAKDLTPAEVKEEEPGTIVKVVRWVTTPFRWVYGKIKESPASAAVGMVVGAAVGVGGKVAYDKFSKEKGTDTFIPADPIEEPEDSYVSSSSSYESTED